MQWQAHVRRRVLELVERVHGDRQIAPGQASTNRRSTYVAQHNVAAAEQLVEEVFAKGDSLASLYRRGRVVPELGRDDVRELLHGDYRVVYVIRRDRVDILTVFNINHINVEFHCMGR